MGELREVEDVHLSNARVRRIDMVNSYVTGAWFLNARIDGDFEGLVMNGVEVQPLIEAELERLHPILKQVRTLRTADDARANLETAYGLWDDLIARASSLDESVLYERVDDEWSFVETLRHMIYATDCWFRHTVLDLPDAYNPIALSHSEARGDDPGIDLDANPSFAETLAVWRATQDEVRAFVAALTDDGLNAEFDPQNPGHPHGKHSLRTCLWVMNNEAYWHWTYATRDLDVLCA